MKLPEGIHALRVPIPHNPLAYVLPYLFVGREGLTLIDAGWKHPKSLKSLVSQLDQLGFGLKDVRQVILTHMHPDHCGLADQIRAESGARVLCHRLESPEIGYAPIEGRFALHGSAAPAFEACGVPPSVYRHASWGTGQYERPEFPEPDELLLGGEVIDAGVVTLEVIWTPGHAAGHICLYDRQHRLLFTGDHVLPNTTPHINSLWAVDDEADPLGDYMASLEKLRPLEVDLALPSHDHIFGDLHGRLSVIEQHHEERLGEILGTASGKWVTPYDVATEVTWTIGSFDSLANTHKIMAVGETLAHLEYLHRRNRLEKKNDDGLAYYRS